MDRMSKIYGLLLFAVLIIGLVYLVVNSMQAQQNSSYESIVVHKTRYLPQADYIQFANLVDPSQLHGLTLADVKGKFEKHPYVKNVEVEFDGVSAINVSLEEKLLKAVLLNDNKLNVVCENYTVLPLLGNSIVTDLPVISNPGVKKENDEIFIEDIAEAFKIIDVLRISDENFYNELAEINLNNGGDVLITFTGMQTPVIFGRGDGAMKINGFIALMNKMNNDKYLINGSSYIDLRYKNRIFIGRNTNSEVTG